jgi:hypothetical protein
MPGTYRKAFEVIKSSKADFEVDTGKRKLKFGKSGGMVINDAGEAKTIEEKYGFKSKYRAEYLRGLNKPVEEAVVIPVDDVRVEAGHKYTFGRHPGVPWAKYDPITGKRLFEEPVGEEDADSEDERQDGDGQADSST